MKHILTLATLCSAFFLTACSTSNQGLYQWGSYEDQVYAMYTTESKTSPQEQLAKLEADGEKARAGNRTPPPGYYAHLGYLYFETGNPERAVASFQNEKTLFPESRPYMDRLISRFKK
ncbi:MAG: DUF4810 domain-containing protein [Oxalobacteraceae bacterium]|jgi:hypothetical protein|nr:DUF4810 domain-containing protein [Oxalobacteraceae bacterium]